MPTLLARSTAQSERCDGCPAWQAEAIIANPISYGHVHLADHLGLPLHFLWTQPETATRVPACWHLSATVKAPISFCFLQPDCTMPGGTVPTGSWMCIAGLCAPPGALPVREDVAGVAPQRQHPRPAPRPHQPHVLRGHPLRHGHGRGAWRLLVT